MRPSISSSLLLLSSSLEESSEEESESEEEASLDFNAIQMNQMQNDVEEEEDEY
jgi:hypothetical protein